MVVAFALGVVLAGFVMVQLVRRMEPRIDVEMVAQAPPTVAPVAPAPAPAPPPTIPAPPPLSDTPATPVAPASTDAPTPPPVPDDGLGTVTTAPSAVDALDVVDDFRRAYEQRNIERLGALFAVDARKGGLAGRDAIIADYRRFFANARDLLYSQPSAAVEPHGTHVIVRAPFEITYNDAGGRTIEVRGIAAWTIIRRDGTTLIRGLDFEITPVTSSGR
jgi:hypothetical protein